MKPDLLLLIALRIPPASLHCTTGLFSDAVLIAAIFHAPIKGNCSQITQSTANQKIKLFIIFPFSKSRDHRKIGQHNKRRHILEQHDAPDGRKAYKGAKLES